MVRSLLEERFGLRVHTEAKQQVAWVLVKTGSGRNRASQLRPHTGEPVCRTVLPEPVPKANPKAGQPAPHCGAFFANEGEKLHLTILDYTMPQIAGELSMFGVRRGGMEELPGVDGTQMTGKFDLDLHFLNRRPTDAPNEQLPDGEPDFLQALSEQAGLEFKKKTAAVEVLVVDQVHEPTAD